MDKNTDTNTAYGALINYAAALSALDALSVIDALDILITLVSRHLPADADYFPRYRDWEWFDVPVQASTR